MSKVLDAQGPVAKELLVKKQNQERPCRPLTAYNIFFHLEKERFFQEKGEGYAAKVKTIDPVDRDLDMDAALRPTRYQNLVLPVEWYVPDPDKKRRMATKKNRDPPHRIITFVELSKMISSEWKAIDEETKAYCTQLADEQLKLYNEEMKVFVGKYGAEAAKKLPKSKTKENKMVKTSKKTAKRTGEGAGGAMGGAELKAIAEVEKGHSMLADVNIFYQAHDHDICKIDVNEKNRIELFRQDQNRDEGQKVASIKQGGCTAVDIDPEPYSKKCDHISPTMSYCASQFANDNKIGLDFDLGEHLDRPNFYSQSTGPSPQTQFSLIENQEVLASHAHTYMMRSPFTSASGPSQGYATEEYYDQNRFDGINPEQGIDFDINNFDWDWDPDDSSHTDNAPMPRDRTEFPLPEFDPEFPARSSHKRGQYSEQNPYTWNGCLGCNVCTCGRSAAFRQRGQLHNI